MIWVDALPVIALMADTHSWWYVSIGKFVSDPMCKQVFSAAVGYPVTVIVTICIPRPAS